MKPPKITFTLIAIVAAWLILPGDIFAGRITAELAPSNNSPATGEKITVSVNVDISETSELLGAFTAQLTWNANVLRYRDHSGGAEEDFANPVMNLAKASEGLIVFAGINPYGSSGKITILKISFEVLGGAGSAPELSLEVKEMVAARTFTNLLPSLQNTVTTVEQFGVAEVPKEYELAQNYPNPFNAGTEIRYALPQAGPVRLEVYSTLGMKVRTLIDAPMEAGRHRLTWNGANDEGKIVSSGIYIYRLQAGSFRAERKLLFVK
jgi:hypothetical protein